MYQLPDHFEHRDPVYETADAWIKLMYPDLDDKTHTVAASAFDAGAWNAIVWAIETLAMLRQCLPLRDNEVSTSDVIATLIVLLTEQLP